MRDRTYPFHPGGSVSISTFGFESKLRITASAIQSATDISSTTRQDTTGPQYEGPRRAQHARQHDRSPSLTQHRGNPQGNASSIFFHTLDTAEIGAVGHSLGGTGALNAVVKSGGTSKIGLLRERCGRRANVHTRNTPRVLNVAKVLVD